MLVETILAWMVTLQDPTVAPARAVHYPELAVAIAQASEANPVFGDAEHTAAVLTAVAFMESGLTSGALGDCGKGKARSVSSCASLGAFQISKAHAPAADLLDVTKAAPIALRLMAQSKRICRGRPAAESLSWYAHGSNGCDFGHEASRHRYLLAMRLLKSKPATKKEVTEPNS